MANNDALVQRIVQIIQTHVNPKQGLSNLKRNQNIVPGIVTIITKSVNTNAVKIVRTAPAVDVAKAITKLIQNSINISGPVAAAAIPTLVAGGQTAAAVQLIKQTNPKTVNIAIKKLIQNKVPIPRPVVNAATQTSPNVAKVANGGGALPTGGSSSSSATGGAGGAGGSSSATGGAVTSTITFSPSIEIKLNGLVKAAQEARNNPNKKPALENLVSNLKPKLPLNLREQLIALFGNLEKVPSSEKVKNFVQKTYSKMSSRELIRARRTAPPENRATINKALAEVIRREISERGYRGSARIQKLKELLKNLPQNYNGRQDILSMMVNDIRNIRGINNYRNFETNLSNVKNKKIVEELKRARRRIEYYKKKDPFFKVPPRRTGESNNVYETRLKKAEQNYSFTSRFRPREVGVPQGGSQANNVNFARRWSAMARQGAGGGSELARQATTGLANLIRRPEAPPPPLPLVEQRAINNAGGAKRALNTIVQVPGGAPEVAKAARALNESRGNVAVAIQVKGASPAAVNAVQKLGGPNNTPKVLSGLNTMAQTHETRKRKLRHTKKRAAVLRPRVAELNRVISAVKKQRMISLVAHNVTKTHNIHPNDEKLKKYYMKVLKANILRTPFAKIAKRAAMKKRVLPSLKGRRA